MPTHLVRVAQYLSNPYPFHPCWYNCLGEDAKVFPLISSVASTLQGETINLWVIVSSCRAKYGKTIDFLLTAQRDEPAAKQFLTKAIRRHGGVPETITIDGSAANAAAIKSYNAEHGTAIAIRQIKYLNNIIEQDHRGVKRITRPMLGFKSFEAAQSTVVGIELMHMLRKGQMVGGAEQGLSAAQQFYALAA